jgi:methylmalonyl-CoA/ethylmalonyl-CoA epimerase
MSSAGPAGETRPSSTPGLQFHHVGYAVQNIAAYVDGYVSSVLRPRAVSRIIEDPIQRVRIAFVELPGGSLELIEPTSPDSPVQQILNRKRGGLYHVGYTTRDFEAAMARAIAYGCRPLSKPVPAAAFGEKRIVFFMTPQFDIIELIEMPDGPTA